MRRVAFVYVTRNKDEEGYYDAWQFSHMIERWTEVDDDTYNKLSRFFREAPSVLQAEQPLVMVTDYGSTHAPKIIEEVLELAEQHEKKKQQELQKRAERKAARAKAKTEKELEEKRKLLEKLKRELGEDD